MPATRPLAAETGQGNTLRLPTPSLVTELQAVAGYPAVSVLMSTTPAPRMLPEDARRLDELVLRARRRLEGERLLRVQTTILEPLERLATRAASAATTEALALYAANGAAYRVHLTLDVADRVVIDPTFATRDLVRVLHRTPRHVVLALSSQEARVFDGLGDQLRPAQVRSFPRRLETAAPPGRLGRRDVRHQRGSDPEERKAFLRDVDRALAAYLLVQPAPLVLVGSERMLAEFRRMSRNLGRLAGCVSGNLITAPTSDLVPRIRDILDGYLRSRQNEALALVAHQAGTGRLVTGIEAVWTAARYGRPEMLAVEEGFFHPARLDESGDILTAATDVEHPDVIDDAVDELIEAVLRRGGWVAMTEDGVLAPHGRVALTMRR